MAKKLPTINEQLYKKEVRRLHQFLRRAEKRGFSFPANIIPKQPKRITIKSVQRLQKLTPEKLYKKATYIEPATGKVVTGEQGRKLERQRAARKSRLPKPPKAKSVAINVPSYPVASYEILNNIRESIAAWAPAANYTDYFKQLKERDKNVLQNMLNGAIRQEGEDEIARRLEASASEVTAIIEEVLYGSNEDRIQGDFSRFSNILWGRSLTNDESKILAESLESLEDSEPPL